MPRSEKAMTSPFAHPPLSLTSLSPAHRGSALYRTRARLSSLALLASLGGLLGCSDGGGTSLDGSGGTAAPGASGGAVETGAGGMAEPGEDGSGGAGAAEAGCRGEDTVSAKRLVRLSFNQVANSLGTLIDGALGTSIVEQFELVDADHRAFPPLQSPREGNSFTDQSWGAVDQIAQAAGQHVVENLEQITGCDADPSDECALDYLMRLSEKAYRRPLSPGEGERLSALYETALRGDGASVLEALEHGVYAVFQSPHFLYRTEFGTDPEAAGALTQLELASMLSYFLTDDTPDEALQQAAQLGELATPEQIGSQVDRILVTPAARENLHGAMMSYFAYPNLETQVIQDDAFTGELRQSMYREAELFLERMLWSEPLDSLLTSKTGFVNEALAPIYGITAFPPPGATPIAASFYEVELAANRTGLLTQAGFLANRSRPDHTSVVGRGLLIKNAFLCTETEPPDEAIVNVINMLQADLPDASEREMAEIRAGTPACAHCHESFDPYGLALDTYDVLGRYRDVDPHGRPIDSSSMLPEVLGGGEAANILDVANQLALSGAFGKCMGQNLVNYALADVSAGAAIIDTCAVERISESFEASDGSFSALVRAVATSAAFSQRVKGEQQ